MSPDPNPADPRRSASNGAGGDVAGAGRAFGDDPGDAAALAGNASALADAMVAALPGWVERSVDRLCTAYYGGVDPAVAEEARDAGRMAQAELGPLVRSLLGQDIDAQRATPLAVARRAVRYPTEVLRQAGVPPVVRDAHAEAQFPDDVYDLAPATFADLDPAIAELGLAWGAAKAHVHKQRRRAEGRT